MRQVLRISAYGYLFPGLFFMGIFTFLPVFMAAYNSFFHWNVSNPTPTFSWFSNYAEVFHAPLFWLVLRNNVLAAEVTGERAPGLSLAGLAALAEQAGEEDPFLLLFTSGTTGRPKGVRLPQRTMVHALDYAQATVGLGADDVGLHFLPYGHVAGHAQFALALAQGHELLMVERREEIELGFPLRPTYLFSVPVVYQRIRSAVERRIGAMPAPLRGLVQRALEAAHRRRLDGSRRWRDRAGTWLADRIVGRAVRARLGGHVRALYVGGAPAPVPLFRFFEALGLPVVGLYGMSETSGMISSNLLAGPGLAGCAGLISPDHEVRFSESGELLLRGPLLLSGFLEQEDEQEARAGSAQVYRVPLGGDRRAERVTFTNGYNARPRLSPDGKELALVTLDRGGYRIGVLDLDGRNLRVLTSARQDESPSFAPNGAMVIYATREGGRGALAIASSDGAFQQRLSSDQGDVREPAWQPFAPRP